MHPMKKFAENRLRTSTIQVNETEGIREIRFTDKGSLFQQVADEILEQDTSLLIKGRWRKLEREYAMRTSWMVRDGWFQLPIVAIWRCSMAMYYIWKGFSYAFAALLGKERFN